MALRTFVAAWLAMLLPVVGLALAGTPATSHTLARLRPLPMLAVPSVPTPSTPMPAIASTPTFADVAPPASDERPRGGTVIFGGPTDTAMVALSFDDGPSPTLTPRVLQVLRDHGAHATFFVLGEQAERHPDALRAIVDAGHELGNHGFSHRSFRSLFPSQIEDELDRTARMIVAAGGERPQLVRPPFGRYPDSTVGLVASRGEDLVLWTIDGRDSDHADAQTIAAQVVRAAQPGAIVLLHDREPDTLLALPAILDGLARKGLRVVGVSELLAG